METSVVVVHGIGDPMPGNALDKLIQGLSGEGWQQVQGTWIETRHERSQTGPDDLEVKAFPVARATLAKVGPFGEHLLYLREVYWGDVSRQKASLFGLISALFDLIFGLRYLVEAAKGQTKGWAKASGVVAYAVLWLIRGPMFALNILAMVVAGLYVWFASFSWPFKSISFPLAAAIVGSLLVLIGGTIVSIKARRLEWTTSTSCWMIAFSLLILILCCFIPWSTTVNLDALIGKWDYLGQDVTSVMTAGATLMALLVICYLAFGAVALVRDRDSRQPLTVVAFCTGLSLAIFTFVVVAIWVVFSKAIRENTSEVIANCVKKYFPFSDYCIGFGFTDSAGTALAERIEKGIHQLPLLVICFALLGAVFLFIAWRNSRMSRWPAKKDKDRLRYIVNPWVVVALVVASAVFAALFAWHGFDMAFRSLSGIPSANTDESGALKSINNFLEAEALKSAAIALSATIVSLVLASRSHFLFALDLLLDVIMHFRINDFEGGDSHVAWDRTVARFMQVVDCELAKDGGHRAVVVLAHSLGSAIAADGLGALEIAAVNKQRKVSRAYKRVSLVTMGSPIINLLKHYLPERYHLQPGAVHKWLNVYRIDDFVGTKLATDLIENHNVGTGGHTDYWSDPRVVPQILAAIQYTHSGEAAKQLQDSGSKDLKNE